MRARLGRLVYKFLGRFIWRFAIHKTHRARVIIRHGNRVLLTKAMVGEQKWELPGGGVSGKEAIIDTAIREIAEETGLKLDRGTISEIGHAELERNGARFTSHFLLCQLKNKTAVKTEWPWILEARWFDIAELPAVMQGTDRAAIAKAASHN